MKPLKLYWSTSKPNFGDALSPLICAHLSGRNIVHAGIRDCELVALGSLMQRVKEHFWTRRVDIWGTGFIGPEKPRKSRHRYHAVRGKLTAHIVQAGDDVVQGDPGLLASLLLKDEEISQIEKTCRCLIIPHYKDRGHPALCEVARNFPEVEVADVFEKPIQLLRRICSSQVVLSSAMHGLIAADSLGVPNAWIPLSNEVRGGDFKFRDYYSVFDMMPNPLRLDANLLNNLDRVTDGYCRRGIEKTKIALTAAFPRIS